MFLKHPESSQLIEALNRFFETKVDVPRVKFGKRQSLKSLINEERFFSLNSSETKRKIGLQEL